MSKGRAFELGPEELNRLLTEAMDAERLAVKPSDEPAPDGACAEEEQDPASHDATRRDTLEALLARPCDRLSILQGRTTGELLLSAETAPVVLRIIKDDGKARARAAGTRTARDVATTLYYAAIAGGIVYHGKRISEFPYDELAESFETLAAKSWMPPALVELFQRAGRISSRQGRADPPPED